MVPGRGRGRRGHGAVRLQQPGEQRARIPGHLPRRAGHPRVRHQRGDEAGGVPRAGGHRGGADAG